MRTWLAGKGKVQSRIICDVRDAARSHIMAREWLERNPRMRFERFIVGQEARVPAEELRKGMAEVSPPGAVIAVADSWQPPPGGAPIGAREMDTSRAERELGVVAREARWTVVEMAKGLLGR